MKIYLAGTSGTESRAIVWQVLIKQRLLSYWDISQKQFAVDFAFNLIVKQNENMVRWRSGWRLNGTMPKGN
ncbi:MAG: hypothetical protein PHC31_01030 [Clostridia bacterium]|nr:hypothetical protein [Clostridia bacterium]MDD3970477.1 hypothetical protein [Clostridia bacterium]